MAENTEFKVVVGADISEIKSKMAELSGIMSNLSNNMNTSSRNIQSSVGGMASNLKSVLSTLAPIIGGLSFAGFIKSSVMASAELEQIKISFEVFTGSVEIANKTLTALKEQALNSPLQFQDITKGAQTLMQYGLTAEQVIPITKMLGDISGGNADKFSRLALAFGQVNASGRLMGQEARQMINAGFNPLQAISEKTGESMASLSKRMRDGQISVQEVGNAFTYATSEGGRFFGMADRQSQTLQGQFNKLQESITFAMAELGTAIANNLELGKAIFYISEQVNLLSDSLKKLNSESGSTSPILSLINLLAKSIIVSFDSLKNAVIYLKNAFNIFISENSGVIEFFKNVLNGVLIVSEKIPILGKYITQLANYWNNFYDTTSKELPISTQINNLKSQIAELQKNPNINLKFGLVNANAVSSKILELQRNLSELIFKGSQKELNLSDKPSGIGKTKKVKAEKVEVIPGTDFITKEEGNKIKQLIELNKQAGIDIDSVYETSYERRLEKLNQSFEKQKALYIKYGLDFKNIQSKYLVEYAELKDAIEQKKVAIITGAMDKSIAQFKDLNPFKFSNKITEFESIIGGLSATDNINAVNEYSNSIYSAFKNFNISLMSGFAEIAGTALSGGFTMESAFKSLGSMILNTVGDLLIQIGTSAVKLGTAKLAIETALTAFGGAGIVAGMGAIAAGTAMKAFARQLGESTSSTPTPSMGGGSSSGSAFRGITSGGAYQYGGSSYASQSIKLSIDLTGAITASPTGYNINKSYETVLRVTGRE